MNLTSPVDVRAQLAALGVRPNRTLGQNFLIDRNILNILIGLGDLGAGDAVLEVGPGLGVLTRELLARVARVVAVEKDAALYRFLRDDLAAEPRLELHHADMLDLDAQALVDAGAGKVMSNLPYRAGTRILVQLATLARPPARMVVTVQTEVAERMVAGHGGRDYGLLSVWIQGGYRVRIARTVSPTCFCPAPEVESAIVTLERRAAPLPEPARRDVFYALTRRMFMQRRKQLRTILARLPSPLGRSPAEAEAVFARAGVDGTARPEDLAPESWDALAGALLLDRPS